tara:strand:- start:1738 stop:2595 length:858 start_codon:yes stop_codon:yes gene_type:complete
MFKKIFNYLILLALIYFIFIHNSEKFTQEESKKKSKKIIAEENNTDVNSLIDSVMEEELFSKPITEEEAAEGLSKNESSVVSKIYNMFNSDNDSTPAEVVGVDEAEEETRALAETNVEEYIEERELQESDEERESEEERELQESDEERELQESEEEITSEEKPRIKKKRDEKCIKTPKYSGKRSKSSTKSKKNMNIYKPNTLKLDHLQKLDDTVPRSIKEVFDEKLSNFKNKSKLSKENKQRIQGCFTINNDSNNKFSVFEADSESPYEMDINANDVHFENYSLI